MYVGTVHRDLCHCIWPYDRDLFNREPCTDPVFHNGKPGMGTNGNRVSAFPFCPGLSGVFMLMAAKAHIRNNKPLIISISTNDAMGMNFKNIGMLMNMKNIYFVPFFQDDPVKKPNSLIGKLSLIPDTIEEALKGKQLQPVLCDK